MGPVPMRQAPVAVAAFSLPSLAQLQVTTCCCCCCHGHLRASWNVTCSVWSPTTTLCKKDAACGPGRTCQRCTQGRAPEPSSPAHARTATRARPHAHLGGTSRILEVHKAAPPALAAFVREHLQGVCTRRRVHGAAWQAPQHCPGGTVCLGVWREGVAGRHVRWLP